MSELRVGAVINGSDGELGKLDALVIDPTTRQVTHLVVSHDRLSPRVLVAIGDVASTSPEVITLDLDEEALLASERFDRPDFNEPDETWANEEMALDPGSYFLEPFASPLDGWVLATHERVPKGEVSIRRGAEVYSSDGTKVGQVDEFLVDPEDGHITHVVLREGHFFKHDEDVVIPVGSATDLEEGRVVLDIDLHEVDALERIPVTRHGHVHDDTASG